jgi:OmpA-OmpF porin, OOP family
MRLRALFFALTALAGVAAGSWWLAEAATARVEREAGARARTTLAGAGETWARIETDGLRVVIAGTAPDEASRFRATELIRQVVDPRRVEDATALAEAPPEPPAFALEILRTEREVSLIGLAPEDAGRAEIAAALAAGGLDGGVTDMLESVAQPAPEGWRPALAFGLRLLNELPRAKISIAPGRVGVQAVADSDDERRAIEDRLAAMRPMDVLLDSAIAAPRPVVAPFAVEYRLEDGAGNLLRCAAETEADIARIARAAGFDGHIECALGLGSPGPGWGEAVTAGIAAVRRLGGGTFVLADLAAELTGPAGVAADTLSAVAADLEAQLPEVFGLVVTAPLQAATRPDGTRGYVPRFDAILLEDGTVRLTGPVQDAMSRDAIQSYAAAHFGHDRVMNTTVIDPHLPDGWPGRVLAGVAALTLMKEGRLEVTPDGLAVEGWALGPDGAEKATALFAERGVEATQVALRYDLAAAEAALAAEISEATDRAAEAAAACAARVQEALDAAPIVFAPGAGTLGEDGIAAVAALVPILRDCPVMAFEIGGHTDSSGAAEVNQRLSEERAEAVRTALAANEDLGQLAFRARGYGAEVPIADNATADGRARNRRIVLTPLSAAETALTVPEERAVGPR